MSTHKHLWIITLAGMASGSIASASIIDADFDQLSWFGDAMSQPLSPWGRLTIDFAGMPTNQYLNLSIRKPGDVEPTWVLRNVGVASLYGLVSQSVSMNFDLGIPTAGVPVGFLDYGLSLGGFMDNGPSLDQLNEGVSETAYQIGGEFGIDTGNPDRPPAPDEGNKKAPKYEGRLAGVDQVDNQPQKPNECVPGAISNSLNYLKKTGKAGESVPSDISSWREILGTTDKGTSVGWWDKKKQYLDDHPEYKISTTIVEGGSSEETLKKVIDAIKQGKDVEIRVKGHAALVAGVRIYDDGRVEIDIFDDNQKDDKKDPMRTVTGKLGGTIGGMEVDRFIIEIPSPSTLAIFAAMMCVPRRRRLG